MGANTPGPEFRGISREREPRSLSRHAQGFDSPLGGRILLHGEAGKPTTAVGVALPQDCASAGRAAATGEAAGWVFGSSGLFRAAGGARAGANGAKSCTHGCFRGSGAVRAGLPGGPPGSFRVRSGAFSGARRAKTGRRRGKTGRSGALRGRERRRWGQKNPFCRKKGGQRGCAGAKTGGVIGGACRVVCPCAGIFGRFRRKSWGFEKAFPRAYRKELPFVPFLCRWRTVSGGDSLVVRSGCFFARKE